MCYAQYRLSSIRWMGRGGDRPLHPIPIWSFVPYSGAAITIRARLLAGGSNHTRPYPRVGRPTPEPAGPVPLLASAEMEIQKDLNAADGARRGGIPCVWVA